MIAEADLAALLERLPTLPETEAQTIYAGLVAELNQQAAQDGLWWLRYVQTRDEADHANAVKPFPLDKPYTHELWTDYLAPEPTVVAKSRQMIVSWETCAFCCWWARYRPHQAVYWQTKDWDDAVMMVSMPEGGPSGGFEGRCQFIESHLPDWMRQDVKCSEGRIQYPNGSIIQALSGGAGKVRGKTPSLLVEDEFAHQENQKDVYTACVPLIQKGAKLIFISSPNGANNQFSTLWHGYEVGVAGAAIE